MPHEQLDAQQVARYLHMDLRQVQKLASRGQIPCRKVGGEFRFVKSDLDHWVELQMHTLDKDELARIEKGVTTHHGYDADRTWFCSLIPDGGIDVPLHARTRKAVVHELVDVADKAGLVYAKDELLSEIFHREELCSTALMPGVALPHPRHPLEYDIAQSFVVVGLTHSGIPFGAEDGSLTRLFFLICCKDERTHLHVLSRLARVLHDEHVVEALMESETPEELHQLLLQYEREVIAGNL